MNEKSQVAETTQDTIEPVQEDIEDLINEEQAEEPESAGEEQEEAEEEEGSSDNEYEVIDEKELIGKKFKIKNKSTGEEIEIDGAELRHGYFRDADYRRKTQELSEVRKQSEQAKEFYSKKFNELSGVVNNLSGILEGNVNSFDNEIRQVEQQLRSIDIRTASQTDLELAQRFKMQLDQLKEQKKVQEDANVEIQKRYQQELSRLKQVTLQEENSKLVKALPEMADEKKGEEIRNGMIKYLSNFFTEKEIEDLNIMDHREMLIINDAMRYRALQNAHRQPKKVNKLVKVQSNDGARQQPNEGKMVYSKLYQKAAKSGKKYDIMELLKTKV